MRHAVINGLLVVFSLLVNAGAIGIDGKLDFGNSRSTSASFRGHNTHQKSVFVPINSKVLKADTSENFDTIGVVCVSGGCNTTTSTNTSSNSIQTDILVHVQTKIDLNDSNTGAVEDTPDVPVVVGYRGSQLDTTIDDESSRSFNPQSIYVPDLGPVSQQPIYTDSYRPSVSTYHHSSLTPALHSRIDSDNHKFVKFHPSDKEGSFYITKTIPNVNINVEPSAVIGTTGYRTDTEQKTNTIEVKIPYFQPSYHGHYYGENPPPQLTWYPKKTSGYNPVEFKTVKSTWSPSVWNRKVPHSHVPSLVGHGTQCNCREGQSTPGVRWYPSTSGGGINDPGSQINDKLAPLNK